MLRPVTARSLRDFLHASKTPQAAFSSSAASWPSSLSAAETPSSNANASPSFLKKIKGLFSPDPSSLSPSAGEQAVSSAAAASEAADTEGDRVRQKIPTKVFRRTVTRALSLRKLVETLPSATDIQESDNQFFASISEEYLAQKKQEKQQAMARIVENYFEKGTPLLYKIEDTSNFRVAYIDFGKALRLQKKQDLQKEQQLYGVEPNLQLLTPEQAVVVVESVCETHQLKLDKSAPLSLSDKRTVLVGCIAILGKDVPVCDLHKIVALNDIIKYFSSPPPSPPSLFPKIDMDNLPANLRIEA